MKVLNNTNTKRHDRNLLLFGIMAVVLLPCASGEQIIGHVRFADVDNSPVVGARVDVSPVTDDASPVGSAFAGRVDAGGITDEDGYYSISGLTPDAEYIVFVGRASGGPCMYKRFYLDGESTPEEFDFVILREWHREEGDDWVEHEIRLAVKLTVNGSPSTVPFYAAVRVQSTDVYDVGMAWGASDTITFKALPAGKYEVVAALARVEVNGVPVGATSTCVVELPASGKVTVELDITGEEE